MKSDNRFTVIRDTREKPNHGWWFPREDDRKNKKFKVEETIEATLDAGDYSIKGYEDIIRIERKMGLRELFANYTPAYHKDRFIKEMEKLRHVKHKYLIIETSLSNDLISMSIPQYRTGLPGSRLIDWVIELEHEYNIIPIFAGECGQRVCREIFENILKRYSDEPRQE